MKRDSQHDAGIWRRDMCTCDRSIIRNILKPEPWVHWGTFVAACRPEEGDRSPVATPRRTSIGDVLVATSGQAVDGGETP